MSLRVLVLHNAGLTSEFITAGAMMLFLVLVVCSIRS